MRQRERADLREQRPPARAQQKQPDDEEDVIEAAGENMREAQPKVLPGNRGSGRGRRYFRERDRRARPHAVQPEGLLRRVADPQVERVGPHREAISESDFARACRNVAGQADARWSRREVVERGSRSVPRTGTNRPSVEQHLHGIQKGGAQRVDASIAIRADRRLRRRLTARNHELRQQRIWVDDDVDLVGGWGRDRDRDLVLPISCAAARLEGAAQPIAIRTASWKNDPIRRTAFPASGARRRVAYTTRPRGNRISGWLIDRADQGHRTHGCGGAAGRLDGHRHRGRLRQG